MNYLTGYTIKPFRITALGIVIFTDGTNNDIRANQQQCQAYGYTYDSATGTCRSFTPSANFQRNLNNIDNKINGAQNVIGTGGKNIHINGTNNTAEGFNNNCFISGNGNTIANGVTDATVVGSEGIAIRDGEFVVGSPAGETSIFALNGTTTDATSTALFVNGDTAVTTIARSGDSIFIYTIDIIAYRTGGASGSGATGDRAFFKIQGIVRNNVANEGITTVASNGTVTGWTGGTAYVGDDMQLKMVGAASMNITWQAAASFQELKI